MIAFQNAAEAKFVPFPHVLAKRALSEALSAATLNWFETAAPWRLRVESFYEQYELNLHQAGLPAELGALIEDRTAQILADALLLPLTHQRLTLAEANAHKLLPGQTIKIHNDFIGGAETHRILIQVNRGWRDENGGLLMLFSSPLAEDVARVIRPLHGSGIGFEISPASFHAVSTIRAGERYTLVYSFKRAA